jgi:hypothetical protein
MSKHIHDTDTFDESHKQTNMHLLLALFLFSRLLDAIIIKNTIKKIVSLSEDQQIIVKTGSGSER